MRCASVRWLSVHVRWVGSGRSRCGCWMRHHSFGFIHQTTSSSDCDIKQTRPTRQTSSNQPDIPTDQQTDQINRQTNRPTDQQTDSRPTDQHIDHGQTNQIVQINRQTNRPTYQHLDQWTDLTNMIGQTNHKEQTYEPTDQQTDQTNQVDQTDQINRQTNIRTDLQTDQTNRQINRQTNKPTRQTRPARWTSQVDQPDQTNQIPILFFWLSQLVSKLQCFAVSVTGGVCLRQNIAYGVCIVHSAVSYGAVFIIVALPGSVSGIEQRSVRRTVSLALTAK